MIQGDPHPTTAPTRLAVVPGPARTADVDLTLAAGETRELSLPSLGTAGFAWSYDLEDGDRILRLRRHRGAPEDAGPVGRSTPERLLITAVAPGRACVRMRQGRPWESGAAPRASFVINVDVVADGARDGATTDGEGRSDRAGEDG